MLGQHVAVCQNLVPLVNIKIAGKWMFIPLKMVLIGIDPYPGNYSFRLAFQHAYFDGFGTHGHRRFYGGTGPVVIDPSPRFETFKMI